MQTGSTLVPPFSISAITDGAGYKIRSLHLSRPNLFTRIGSLGDLIVKVPSDRGQRDFAAYVKDRMTDLRKSAPMRLWNTLKISTMRSSAFPNLQSLKRLSAMILLISF
jgi:hypothetical protein